MTVWGLSINICSQIGSPDKHWDYRVSPFFSKNFGFIK